MPNIEILAQPDFERDAQRAAEESFSELVASIPALDRYREIITARLALAYMVGNRNGYAESAVDTNALTPSQVARAIKERHTISEGSDNAG